MSISKKPNINKKQPHQDVKNTPHIDEMIVTCEHTYELVIIVGEQHLRQSHGAVEDSKLVNNITVRTLSQTTGAPQEYVWYPGKGG